MAGIAWLGSYGTLKHVLRTFGNDFDIEGNPILCQRLENGNTNPGPNQGIAFFVGDHRDSADVVVDDTVHMIIGGKVGGTVVYATNQTSYGVRGIAIY
jgi:hypothetical protein